MRGTARVSVIVVSYRVREEVRGCVRHLRDCTVPLEVFVVDNNSNDGTREMLEAEFADWEALHVICLDENVGLAAANNVPMAQLTGDYVLILNPDTVPTSATLHRLVRYLDEHPDVGVAGPKQLYANGAPHSSFHSGWGLAHIALWSTIPRGILKFWYDRPARLVRREVLFVSGACLLIRNDIFRAIGGYDPHYFLAVEDVADLCRRVQLRGHRVMYVPEAEIIHYGARSYSQVKPFALLKGTQGHLYYVRKWGSRCSFAAASAVLLANSVLRAAVYAFASVFRPGRFWPYAKAHVFVMRYLFADLPPVLPGETHAARPPLGSRARKTSTLAR